MEWWLVLTIIFGSLFILLLLGTTVAFAFLMINITGMYLLWNGGAGIKQLILSISDSVTLFSLLPIPMFIFMGEIMFRSGLGSKVMDSLSKWMGRIPGRLSLLAVGGGTLFSTLGGSSIASTAMLGSLLVPDMDKKGYKRQMSIGPILGSGGLASMIPPSALGVILATVAGISVGDFLIAIVIPGLLLAIVFTVYIIIRCTIQPHLAPSYEVENYPLKEKLKDAVIYILPLGIIVFLVIGTIIFGLATPSEAAALGALGNIILIAVYGKMSWTILKDSLKGTLHITVMIFMIMAGSMAFSQLLSSTGATNGLIEMISDHVTNPLIILIFIQLVLVILGCFMDPVPIMIITVPIIMPIAASVGFDPLWFSVLILLNMELASISPPFGMGLFAMKGVAPKGTTMGEIYRASFPFLLLIVFVMVLLTIYPQFATWLPSLMK